MENWQLTLVILASVLVGALIPLLIMMAIAFHRAGREIAEIGARLARTLAHTEIISDRVEMLSRGFKGGEKDIADLLACAGDVARGLERNMKIVNVISPILASVGPAIASFIKTRFPAEGAGKPHAPDVAAVPENGPATSPSASSPEAIQGAK